MKRLNAYITESLLTGNVAKPRAKEQPSSKKELEQIIDERIKEIKPRPGQEVDLNWIDISKIDNLSWLFYKTDYIPVIDTWKIDQVKDFSHMFAYNEHIVRSPLPVLQKKLLMNRCYGSMFFNCTSLEEPPVLPAKNLVHDSYMSMFAGCTALKVAPELPATKLEEYCYWNMFLDCTALKVAPKLPATQLAFYCYKGMFEGCTALTRAPELPAKTLERYCYSNMFYGCTALKVAPALPAEKLETGCYDHMFHSCTSLTAVAKTPPVSLVNSGIHDMYKGTKFEK